MADDNGSLWDDMPNDLFPDRKGSQRRSAAPTKGDFNNGEVIDLARDKDGWRAPSGVYGGSTYYPPKRCHLSHPEVPIANGVFIGGSSSDHEHIEADIYVGLDTPRSPLFRLGKPQPVAVHYPIVNMSVPKREDKFKALIEWLYSELLAGKRVHVGCIGGHGRTGLILAALLHLDGEADPIAKARDVYCKKAVESAAQVNYLVKLFGMPTAKPSKGG